MFVSLHQSVTKNQNAKYTILKIWNSARQSKPTLETHAWINFLEINKRGGSNKAYRWVNVIYTLEPGWQMMDPNFHKSRYTKLEKKSLNIRSNLTRHSNCLLKRSSSWKFHLSRLKNNQMNQSLSIWPQGADDISQKNKICSTRIKDFRVNAKFIIRYLREFLFRI